jgi:hypothetical protein
LLLSIRSSATRRLTLNVAGCLLGGWLFCQVMLLEAEETLQEFLTRKTIENESVIKVRCCSRHVHGLG